VRLPDGAFAESSGFSSGFYADMANSPKVKWFVGGHFRRLEDFESSYGPELLKSQVLQVVGP